MATRRNSVLVADDDGDVREVLAEQLRLRGFEVAEAGNGLDALLHVKRARPRAVVMDLHMPRLGGIDAIVRIRAFDPTITVVVVTADINTAIHRQALAFGAVAVLNKPVAFADLVSALAEAPSPRSSFVEEAPSAGASRPGRVLVVDDDPEVRALFTDFLAMNNYIVRAVDNGAEAIRTVVEEAPDVVLLDIEMPRFGGFEALAAITAIAPAVKVIMVSGISSVETARSTLAHGAFDYIPKPPDLEYLKQSLEAALTMARLDAPLQE